MKVRQHWRALLLGAALLITLALARLVRDAPIQIGIIRIDSLTIFFTFATLAATMLAIAMRLPVSRRVWLGAALLIIAYTVTLTAAIAVLCALVVVVEASGGKQQGIGGRWPIVVAIQRVLGVAVALIVAATLLIGYGALALGGALHYDDRAAGAAFSSLVFWFVLLAAMLVVTPAFERFSAGMQSDEITAHQLVVIAVCYPLVRLYSVGPWNSGWSYATLLFGGAAALWSALATLTTVDADRRLAYIRRTLAALVLISFGLGTGAGIAAGCYGLLALLVMRLESEKQDRSMPSVFASRFSVFGSPLLMFVAPFVTLWMLLGAALAGGAQALALAVWFAALICAVALLLGGKRATGIYVWRAGLVSLALGIGAPLVVLWLIEPVIELLQGGLTPYGDVVVWPWVGLAIKNSANTQIATLPTLAVAGMLLLLTAIVYLVTRVYEPSATSPEAMSIVHADDPSQYALFVKQLRAEVPWLDVLLPAERSGAKHLDGE